MINHHISRLLVLVVALGLTGCESLNAPIEPSPIAESSVGVAYEGAGAAAFRKPPDTGDIVIDRGELDFTAVLGGGEIRLVGNREFSLTGHVHRDGGIVEAVHACAASNCTPGTVIQLRALWSDTDLPSTVTLDGTTYTGVGGLMTSALVEFSGSVVAPPLTKRRLDQVTAPFTMSGRFSYPGGVVAFTGEGLVKVWLAQAQFPGSIGWEVERLLYRFKHRS